MGTDVKESASSLMSHSVNLGLNAAADYQIDIEELMKGLKIIAKEENIKATLKYSAATGAITGVSTVVGGLILTPFGLTAVGAVLGTGVGSLTSFVMFKDKYISLVEIIDNLPEAEKEKLAEHLKKGLKDINVLNTAKFLMLLTSKDKQLMHVLRFFLQTYHSQLFQTIASQNGGNKAKDKQQPNSFSSLTLEQIDHFAVKTTNNSS